MVKRLFQAVVLFFAMYAFAFVPLGRKTALEHVLAIARTPAAHQAASEVGDGVTRLVKRLRTDAQRVTHAVDDGTPENGADAPEPQPQAAPHAPELQAPEPPAKPSHPAPPHLVTPPAAHRASQH
jgi:hypothetical protein